MRSALRVLQAADLNLHEPLESVGRLAAPLREVFNQARERTALKVFNAALSQEVDLLLLSGPLADFDAEPRLACFLMEQFRRLNAGGVSIVWTTNRPSQLPVWSLRPEHVACLQPGNSLAVYTARASRKILIHHQSEESSSSRNSAEIDTSARELIITIRAGSASTSVDYSGVEPEQTVRHEVVPVQLSGPIERGPHGMRFTELIHGERPQTTLMPAATIGWETEMIDLAQHPTRESLLNEISQRSTWHREHAACDVICLEWVLTGVGSLWEELVCHSGPDQLLQEIRDNAGRESSVWTWNIHLQPSAEQYRIWSDSPALAEGLRQIDQLSTADLAASASVPSNTSPHLRGPVLTQNQFTSHRLRLVRELRNPITVAGNIPGNH